MEELRGHWALVTGAGRGIGRSVALALARRGIGVIGVARTENDLQSLKKDVEKLGAHFRPFCLDLSMPDSAEKLFGLLGAGIQDLRIICLNAATNAAGPFEQIPMEVQERLIFLNVIFPMKFVHLMIPSLKTNGDSFVVSMSSQGALFPTPWMATYSASKAFLHSMSLALAGEFKNTRIHFITVIPAHTETSVVDSLELSSEVKHKLPTGRPPEEIAELIARSLRPKPPVMITNVKALFFSRGFAGLAPFSMVIRLAGRMFSMFNAKAYYPKDHPVSRN